MNLIAAGVCTNMGDATSSVAAFRAGVSLPEILNEFEADDESGAVGFPARHLTNSFSGMGRLAVMAAAALDDLLSTSLSEPLETIPVLFCLPRIIDDPAHEMLIADDIDEIKSAYTQRFLNRVATLNNVTIPNANQYYYFDGEMGFLNALNQARQILAENNCPYCLIGAADSLVDIEKLTELAEQGRIKDDDNPAGLMPGEAAVFLLLSNDDQAEKNVCATPVSLTSYFTFQENNDFYSGQVSTALALTRVVDEACKVAGVSEGELMDIYININGEVYRSHEWGLVSVKSQYKKVLADASKHYVAESFGETGTVSLLLACACALKSWVRGYSAGNKAIVLAQENRGIRASLLLQSNFQSDLKKIVDRR